MYVYIQTEKTLWTVGFYAPDGKWHSESDHGNKNDAAERVHWLNGGKSDEELSPYQAQMILERAREYQY